MLTCASLSTNLSLKEPRSLTLLPFALQQCLPLMPSIVVFRTPNPTPPQLLFLVSPPLLALVALALSPVPMRRVPDCRLPDGTFRLVRTVEANVVANVGTVATDPTSLASRSALQIYRAALDDLDTPAEDIAFLRSIYETERQDDFDRANHTAYTGVPYQAAADDED